MKKGDQKVKLGFTTIQHDPRIRFELSNNDYCVADAIYHLSHNPESSVYGWCYASREKLGKFFGLSRQSVITIIKKLQSKGLIEINQDTNHLRTTQLWYSEFVMFELRKRSL